MFKAILADDERRVRNAIRKLGNWEELGIQVVKEVQDGDELCECIETERPHIVITDMRMPGLSGAELIKKLGDAYPAMEVIVVSGFDDFQYMKQAISSKVIDYLLKPVHQDALNEALRNAVKELTTKRQLIETNLDVQIKLNESLPLLNENILNQYILGIKLNEDEFLKSLGISGIPPQEISFAVVLAVIENYQEIVAGKFMSAPYLLVFAIVNVMNELIAEYGKAFRSKQNDNEVCIIFYRRIDSEHIQEILEDMSKQLLRLLNVMIFTGVGSPYSSPMDIKFSMNEARAALSQLNVKERKIRISMYDKQHLYASYQSLTGRNEDYLSAAISSGNIIYIKQIIEKMYKELSESEYMNMMNIRKLNTDILFQLERLVEATENKLPWLNELISLRNKIENEMNLSFVQACILHYIELISEFVMMQKKERKAIYEIKDYLDQNFTQKQSLQQLSNLYFLSKEHISKLFKEQFGMNLFEYITSLKIEKAKLLLSKDNGKVRSIAEELGFNDESHFSKTFKKHTGLSPRAFRGSLD